MAMAGLVATAQQVADLAGDWERWLRATTPGKIAYFKMDEAIHLYGEFQHWSEENRDAKSGRWRTSSTVKICISWAQC